MKYILTIYKCRLRINQFLVISPCYDPHSNWEPPPQWLRLPPLMVALHRPVILQWVLESFEKRKVWTYLGVSLNGGKTPHVTPQNDDHFLVGKPHGCWVPPFLATPVS